MPAGTLLTLWTQVMVLCPSFQHKLQAIKGNSNAKITKRVKTGAVSTRALSTLARMARVLGFRRAIDIGNRLQPDRRRQLPRARPRQGHLHRRLTLLGQKADRITSSFVPSTQATSKRTSTRSWGWWPATRRQAAQALPACAAHRLGRRARMPTDVRAFTSQNTTRPGRSSTRSSSPCGCASCGPATTYPRASYQRATRASPIAGRRVPPARRAQISRRGSSSTLTSLNVTTRTWARTGSAVHVPHPGVAQLHFHDGPRALADARSP